METALGAASWLLGKVVTKLSDELVAAYMSSSELGLNFKNIELQLLHTQGLLHESQGRDVSNNPALHGLLEKLSKKADEAEDILDELHYFIIQDELDDTEEAAKETGGGLHAHALHGHHVVRHIIGNWFPCFSCWPTQDDDSAAAATSNKHITHMSDSSNDGGTVDKLPFDRIAMSNKIKSVIEEMNSICLPVSDLLKIGNHNSTATNTHVTLKRPPMGSIVAQDKKIYGRSSIFEQIVNALTGGTYHGEILSVLPFVGPGGIGKKTFAQHLYNDERIKGHFSVRVWVCVSTDFDVIELTREILSCILATEKEQNTSTTQTTNLDQLQKSIAEKLKSKRFLIVLDDIWKCNSEGDWKNLLAPFTKGEAKGSMVLVTTRFPSIAHVMKTTDLVELHGLEPDDFFALFEACIFGDTKPGHYEDDLIDVAKDIAMKLRGSPLAANTVGRLLKKNFSREYWMGVLEKNEWQNTKNDDDIMPSLKISYYYLPFHLKKCFSYCALFPEDHRFYNLEITTFWIAIGIIDSNCQNDKNYLEELVDNGFLIKEDDDSAEYYVMHDLLHELSRNVSSQECVNISSSNFRADDIPRSIRHLSITVEDKGNKFFGEEIGKLKSIIDIGNLRTLMVFGSHGLIISNILKDTFEEIKGLRVLFIEMSTQEYLPKGFSNLIHLQYLKLMSTGRYHGNLEITLPSTLSRFYHLKFLDLKSWRGSEKMPKNISHLVNIRHLCFSKELHSNIPEVGKMKHLQGLKEFHVKKENVGYELRQLGELKELGGELVIFNLETVATKGEASDARLKNKRNLKQLKLVWGREHETIVDGDVLEGLEPPSNLRELGIKKYGSPPQTVVDGNVIEGLEPPPNLRVLHVINSGAVVVGPSWLFSGISMQRLETLYLKGVSWGILPPFEQLPHLTTLVLENIAGIRVLGPGSVGVTERSFMHLKTIEIAHMSELEEWVGGPNSPLFSRLERIECYNCPLLSSFSFLECCTNLRRLSILDCPALVSQLPPLPHTCALTHMSVGAGVSSFLSHDGKEVSVNKYDGALAFQNMDKVEVLTITDSPHVSLSFSDLQKLSSLRKLVAYSCDNIFSTANNLKELELAVVHDESMDKQKPEAELEVAISKSMHDVAAGSFQLEELIVDSMSSVLIAPICSRLAATLHTLRFWYDEQVEILTEEQEQALHLLTSLQHLEFFCCRRLRSLPRGLYRLCSLRELQIIRCRGIESLLPKEDLPLASLQILDVRECSEEIKEQANKLKETDPCLLVKTSYLDENAPYLADL